MEGQYNLFGEYQKYPEEKKKGRMRFKTMQEIHGYTEDETCGTCEHCKPIQYAKKYYKCELWILSHSKATDIRLKDRACALWKSKPHKQTCPICKKTVAEVKAWIHCPKEDKPVCMNHCFSGCRLLNKDSSIIRCTYKKQQEKNTLHSPC